MLSNKLRISFVSDLILDTDLHKTRELEILRALAKRGHDITFVAVTSRRYFQIGDHRINLLSVPIRHAPIISHLIYTAFLFLYLPLHILLKKPDLIVMDPDISVISSIPSIFISKFSKTKFILDIKSTPVEVKGINAKLFEFWFDFSVTISKLMFHGFDVVTPMMKTEVCERYNINPETVSIWTNGVPLHLFDPQICIAESSKLKEQLGLSKKFVVFYHGVFSASRGLTETIKAIEITRKKHPHIVFFILGSGVIADNLKDYVQKQGLQENVIIHDPVPYEEVPKYIGLSDVCIVPLQNNSYWRFQSPLKLLEYLAMEKVVLTSDIVAHRTVVNKEKCCIYLTAVSPLEIAQSIDYAYTNQSKRCEWGKIGRTIVKNQFTWDKVAQDVERSIYSLKAETV
jgi:glycosyltransferase involved in cell wall biosynthesis